MPCICIYISPHLLTDTYQLAISFISLGSRSRRAETKFGETFGPKEQIQVPKEGTRSAPPIIGASVRRTDDDDHCTPDITRIIGVLYMRKYRVNRGFVKY
jgi:hypothetical protein